LRRIDRLCHHASLLSTAGDGDRARAYAAEIVALKPDVIVASTENALSALLRETQAVPIVFTQIADPVAGGYVASLARPGGNVTGFTLYEFAIGVKWLELLKQIAPNVNRVAVIYDPGGSSADGYLSAIEAGAPSFGVRSWPPFRMSELSPADWNGPIVKPVETGALRMCPDAGALTGNGRNPRGTQITLYESQNERREDRAMRRARNIRYRCGSAFPPARTWRPEGPCIGRSSCRPALQPGH